MSRWLKGETFFLSMIVQGDAFAIQPICAPKMTKNKALKARGLSGRSPPDGAAKVSVKHGGNVAAALPP